MFHIIICFLDNNLLLLLLVFSFFSGDDDGVFMLFPHQAPLSWCTISYREE